MEPKKIQVDLTKDISNLKAEIKCIKWPWEKSAFEIKDNILVQASVICPRADFSQIGPHRRIVDGHIEDVPEDEDNGANPESDPSNPEAALWYFYFHFSFCICCLPIMGLLY